MSVAEVSMKYLFAFLISLPAMSLAQYGGALSCGLKPLGNPGCRQVCINGSWNEVCDKPSNGYDPSIMACGMKPMIQYGCKASCMNGKWVEVCE